MVRYIVFRFPLTLDEVSTVKTVGLRFHPPHFTAVDNQNKESFHRRPVEHVTRMIHMADPLPSTRLRFDIRHCLSQAGDQVR